nr:hypothetical protein [uncultured Caproiciproducens sp.]
MAAYKKKLGWGTASFPIVLIGLAWSFSFSLGGFCIGDTVLNAVGLKAWSGSGNMGAHFTVYYSLLFFIAAFALGYRNKEDFGAKIGRTAALVIGILILVSVIWLVV